MSVSNFHCSEICCITCGVPQGSGLGPLLFLLYMNDLPSISKKLKFYLFADDRNLYFNSIDLDYLQTVVNKELKKASKWLRANRLALNIDKTNYLIFHSAQVQLSHPTIIKIDKKPITQERSVKYLVMILDPALSWRLHITELAKTLSRTIGIFYKLRYLIPNDILKMLYNALIHPFVLYGVTAWGLTFPSYLDMIPKLQKTYLCVVTFSDHHGTLKSNVSSIQYN